MYVVIFKSKITEMDEEYHQTALRMRALAENKYGCTEFVSLTENDDEIALSYWGIKIKSDNGNRMPNI